MAKNDYHVRNIYWKTMKTSDRFWFVVTLVMLALLVVAIVLDGTNTVNIPSWAIVMWVPCALYSAYNSALCLTPMRLKMKARMKTRKRKTLRSKHRKTLVKNEYKKNQHPS